MILAGWSLPCCEPFPWIRVDTVSIPAENIFQPSMINNDKGIVWISSNNPPIAKMILVSAGTEPSAPDPLVAAEGVDLAFITTTIMTLTFRG